MIKSIAPMGRYMQTTGGSPMTPYISPGAQGAGQVRYNTNSSNMEVWDGISWKEISSNYASIGLTGEAESLLDWARDHRAKVIAQEQLMQSHPGIRDLKEKLDIMVALATKEHDGTR